MVSQTLPIVLGVGLSEQAETLRLLELPFIHALSGREAIRYLVGQNLIRLLISSWDLPDMPRGEVIRRVKPARPWLKTILLMEHASADAEIAARQLGVTLVLPAQISSQLLADIVTRLVGSPMMTNTQQHRYAKTKHSYTTKTPDPLGGPYPTGP